MSLHDLSTGVGLGLLLDDPVCGRMLLDCGVGVLASAALAGVPLAGVAHVLVTGVGTDCLDPEVSSLSDRSAVARVHIHRPNDNAGDEQLPEAVRRLSLGPDGVGWLIRTSRGWLLHCRTEQRLPPAALAELPAQFAVSVPLAAVVSAQLGDRQVDASRWPLRVLVLGGSRSGKSEVAERMLAGRPSVSYLACGLVPGPDDIEWRARVERHRARRPVNWQTVESLDAAGEISLDDAPLLWDSVGTWVSGQLEQAGCWAAEPGSDDRFSAAVAELIASWGRPGRDVVAVSEEVGSGVVPGTASGRRFRDELGRLNVALAAAADEVWLVTAGIARRLK